jgi:hypothetical protein
MRSWTQLARALLVNAQPPPAGRALQILAALSWILARPFVRHSATAQYQGAARRQLRRPQHRCHGPCASARAEQASKPGELATAHGHSPSGRPGACRSSMGVLDACCSAEAAKPTDLPIATPGAPPPSAAPATTAAGAVESAAQLTAELQQLSVPALVARATMKGVPAQALQGAKSSADEKTAIIALLVAQETLAANAPTVEGTVDQVFNAVDKDGDGKWSMDEVPQTPMTGAIFSFLDKDGDGKITKTELLAGITAISGMAFMYVSKNGVPPQLHAYLAMIPGAAEWLPAAAKS